MRKVLISLLCVGVLGCGFEVHAVHHNQEGLLLTPEDMYGLVGAAVAGSATFGMLYLFEPYGVSGTGKQLLISAGSACIAAGITYLIARYLYAKNRSDFENYRKAHEAFEFVSEVPLMKIDLIMLLSFVRKHYGNKEPFGAALERLKELRNRVLTALADLGALLENSSRRKSGRERQLYKKSKELLELIKGLYVKLLERRTIISAEHDYELAKNRILQTRLQVEDILQGEQLVAVKDSYDKTVAYGVSMVDEMWPLVTVVKELRYAIKTMSDGLKDCVAQREYCLEKNEDDSRYVNLTEAYDALVIRIKNEFSFDLFERRIKEIFSSDSYKEQGKLLEKKKRHEDMLKALRKMHECLEEALCNIKGTLLNIKNDTAKVKGEVGTLKSSLAYMSGKLSNVKRSVAAIETKIGRVSGDVSTIKSDVTRIRNENRRDRRGR